MRLSDVDAWMIVALKGEPRNVIIALSSVAYHECYKRFGAYDIVMTWDEVRALAAGVQEVSGGERLARLRDGLQWFRNRQGLSVA